MKFVILLGLVAFAAANPAERAVNDADCGTVKIQDRIVGGTYAKYGQYPWIISLKFIHPLGIIFHSCGGSIIDDQWILTAGHCFINSVNPASFIVRVATYNHSAGTAEPEARDIKVAKVLRHSGFAMQYKVVNDIALLKLEEKVNFGSKYVNRICLPTSTSSHPTDGHVLKLAGWGDTVNGSGKALPQLLKQTELNAQTEAFCKGKWGSTMWTDGMHICANAAGTSPCVGDSGGPLIIDNGSGTYTQVGIVSFGEATCGTTSATRPGVYTRVAYFLDWIKQTMAAN